MSLWPIGSRTHFLISVAWLILCLDTSSIACLIAGASLGMAFMEASASASGGRANGMLTGAGVHGSVGFGRGTTASTGFGRDSAGFDRGTRVRMCLGRDRA